MLRIWLDRLYLFAGYAAGAFLVAIFALMMIMSVGREFRLNVPAGDDFAAWSMAAMAFLGLAHTFKSGEMIRVGLLLERLKGRTRKAFELAALGVSLVFVGYFARHAYGLAHDSWRLNDLSQGVVSVPLWIPQSAVAIGLIILTIAILDEFVHVAQTGRTSFEKPPPRTTEELLARVAEGGGV